MIARSLRAILTASLAFVGTLAAAGAADRGTVTMLAEADAVDPALIEAFSRQSGLRVLLDSATPDAMTAVLQRGGTDLVMLPGDALRGLVKAGLLAPLDPAVPARIEPGLARRLAALDEDGRHAVPIAWFQTLWVVNTAKLAERKITLEASTVWDALARPEVARRIADCGLGLPEEPRAALAAALAAVARNPDAPEPIDARRAVAALGAIRQVVQRAPDGALVDGLATGSLCAALVPGPSAWQASDRVGTGEDALPLATVTPPHARLFVDMLAVAAKAPNTPGALALLNFLLEPAHAAQNAAYAHATSTVSASPPPDLIGPPELDPAIARSLAMAWPRAKSR